MLTKKELRRLKRLKTMLLMDGHIYSIKKSLTKQIDSLEKRLTTQQKKDINNN